VDIGIVTNDTRGGVQPYVALACGLMSAGHTVRAVAPGDLAPLFATAGVPVTPLDGQMRDVVRLLGGAVEGGALTTMRGAAREFRRRIAGWRQTTLEALTGCDALLGGIGGATLGLDAARQLGVPFVEAQLQPVRARSAAYPPVLLTNWALRMGRWSWPTLHRIADVVVATMVQGPPGSGRRHGAPRARRRVPAPTCPVLYGISPHVVPIASSPRRSRLATGYWFMPAAPDHAIPAPLREFVARPGPVVSVGFGSMPSSAPHRDLEILHAVAARLGIRIVVLSGWSGMAAATDEDRVFMAPEAPHDWLFPRMRANVHHGGAGTTAAALRAGRPSVVVPFTMDQPFWGSRVHALGVGPAPIPRRTLDEDALARALETALQDGAMRQRAADLGMAIAREDGVRAAVGVLERSLCTGAPRGPRGL
jgi:UDP:flavonoid glycosyltransferase YjiC (YdhE family)